MNKVHPSTERRNCVPKGNAHEVRLLKRKEAKLRTHHHIMKILDPVLLCCSYSKINLIRSGLFSDADYGDSRLSFGDSLEYLELLRVIIMGDIDWMLSSSPSSLQSLVELLKSTSLLT